MNTLHMTKYNRKNYNSKILWGAEWLQKISMCPPNISVGASVRTSNGNIAKITSINGDDVTVLINYNQKSKVFQSKPRDEKLRRIRAQL